VRTYSERNRLASRASPQLTDRRGRKFEFAGAHQLSFEITHVELAAMDVLHMAAFISQKFGLKDLHHEIVQSWQ